MAELKGFMFAMLVFVAFIVPLFISVFVGSINQHAFMKITTEMTEMVKEEGGVTDRIKDIRDILKRKGYTISFTDAKGAAIDGGQPFGTQIYIDYQYDYQDITQVRTLETNNSVTIFKR